MALQLSYIEKNDSSIRLPLPSVIVMYVMKFASIDQSLLTVTFINEKEVISKRQRNDCSLKPSVQGISMSLRSSLMPAKYSFYDASELQDTVTSLPSLNVEKKGIIVAGLCAVLRHLLKLDFENKQGKTNFEGKHEDATTSKKSGTSLKLHPLLGFQGTCLSAPAEVSSWTHFCELDVVHAVNKLLLKSSDNLGKAPKFLHAVLDRFEAHLSEPVRMNNIRKRLQEERKMRQQKRRNDSNDYNEVDADLADVDAFACSHHLFAEGPDLLLSDAILFCLISIALKVTISTSSGTTAPLIMDRAENSNFSKKVVDWQNSFPLITKWMHRMKELDATKPFDYLIDFEPNINIENAVDCNDNGTEVDLFLLSSSLQSKLTSSSSQGSFTCQSEVDRVLSSLSSHQISKSSFWPSLTLDWASLPSAVNPQLPEKRIERKRQQLNNMIAPVLHIAKDMEQAVIVDFCSGGGHLGLALAHLLPNAKVVLVENKEQSINRAVQRIEQLSLKNCVAVQSNLDYFVGDFDIGVSLHACGVATDLVIKMCLSRGASLVCCPCCYGSLRPNLQLNYPRSRQLASITDLQSFLVLCHTADQTGSSASKTSQGELAMHMVDTDRVLAIRETEEYADVVLASMEPLSCSPKHNIIVALKKN